MGDLAIWVAALTLYSDADTAQLESIIYSPTRDGCEEQVQAWIDDFAINMLAIDDSAWVEMDRAECRLIMVDEPWLLDLDIPPPAMTPERDRAPE